MNTKREEFAARLVELIDSFLDKGLSPSIVLRELSAAQLIPIEKHKRSD